jgi:hypothetical protein
VFRIVELKESLDKTFLGMHCGYIK